MISHKRYPSLPLVVSSLVYSGKGWFAFLHFTLTKVVAGQQEVCRDENEWTKPYLPSVFC